MMDKIRTLKYLGEESYKYSKEILGNNGKVWFDFHFDKFFKVCDLGLVGERCIEVISVGKDKDIAQFLREATERLRNAGANFVVIDAFNCETMYFDMMANESYTDEKSLSGKQEKKEILKRGRRSKPFKDYLQNDDGSKLQNLHDVMSGKGGKEVALVIKVAIQIGWITKPTYKAVADEFGDIGNRSNYNKYINGDKFTSDEIVGIKAKLQN